MSRRQAGADYYGINRQDAAIQQWKGLNQGGLNPVKHMDIEDFGMAYDYMMGRILRMIDAMLDVFPQMEGNAVKEGYFFQFLNEYELYDWRNMFARWIFKQDDNLVWPLIRDEHGLTQMRVRAHVWMEDIINQRNKYRMDDPF